jgi:GH24 family phage-related lysozyme (muramidase)
MKTSEAGIKLITSFEGCKLHAYKVVDSEKYYTIGYGHYGPDVIAGMQITQNVAEELLKKDLLKFERHVMKYDPIYHYTQNEFDALVSFAYNVGNIDQLTAYGKRNKATIAGKFPLYNKSGGKVLSGLTKRRAAEQAMFLGNTSSTQNDTPTLKKGSKGEYVKLLQTKLNENGKFNLTIDGIFGMNTYNAVIGFQGMMGLTKDGVVGPLTWKELLS